MLLLHQKLLQPDHGFKKKAFSIADWKRHLGIIKDYIRVSVQDPYFRKLILKETELALLNS